MLTIPNVSLLSQRLPAGLRLAGLAALAGLAYGVAATTPAAAASPDWRAGCQFSAAPQGYGDSIRYTNCMRQRDCQQLANASGATMFAAGCFGVRPETPAAEYVRRPAR